jgi:phosphate transport system substrate-binding protein
MKRKFGLSQNAANRRAMAQAVMLAMGVVAQASAQAAGTLYGGGATLPAVGYEGGTQALGNGSNARLVVNTTDTKSLFGAYKIKYSTTVSYCQTGSGTGKRVLGGVTGYAADNTCGDFTTTPLGFSAPSGQHDPNFAASDAPLSQSEYSSVINSWGSAHTAPVQFPVVAGAVGILYNNTSVSSLNLSDSQVCQIFSGQITNWSQLGAAAKAITVVYRSDGSGTTFSLSNHLSAVCAAYLPSGDYFTTDQSFTNVAAHSGGIPAGASGQSGNPNVVSTVGSTDGAIGYGEIADALARNPALTYATVNGQDPVSNLAATFTVTTTTGQVISGVDSTGHAVLSAVTGGSQTQCLVMAVPSSYANPASGYPIVAVSNLLGYYSGNSTNSTLIGELLGAPWNTTIRSLATDIGSGKGLVYLADASGNLSTVSSGAPSAISNCVTN